MLNYKVFNSSSHSLEIERPYLVFVHGNSGSLRDVSELARVLEDLGLGLIAIDLPGHGKSKSLKGYKLLAMAALVSKTVNDLNLKEYHLLGHSLGGHVLINALDLLKITPKSLWLMGTPPLKVGTSFDELFHELKESQILFKNEVTDCELKAYFEVVLNGEFHYKSEGNTEYIAKPFNQFFHTFRQTDIRFREELLSSLSSGELQDELNILNRQECPIHFLVGENDPLINKNWLKKCSKELNSWGKDTKVFEIKGACHYPHMEKPNLVKDILLEFFRKLNHSQNYEFGLKNETRYHHSPHA